MTQKEQIDHCKSDLESEDFVTREVDQIQISEPELQVPDIRADPVRGKKHLRRLMQEEEQRAAEEEQPIANTVNMIAWSVVCVMIGWIIALI